MTKRQTLIYDGPGGPFEGTLSLPDVRTEPLPGVLVVHAFGGQSEFDSKKADDLADMGYVGLAIDLYGQGRRGSNPDEARALMGELTADRMALRRRMQAALETLRARPEVDAAKTAAIGFCFGGKSVLDLARSGSDILGVASFHGVYDAPDLPRENISAKILLLHGWDDPLVPPETTLALTQELDAAGADWEICAYSGTGHAFTNPAAQSPETGMAHHPRNAARAWARMGDFLSELFGE